MVSGSRDHTLAIWKFTEDIVDSFESIKKLKFDKEIKNPHVSVVEAALEPAYRIKEHEQAIRSVKIQTFSNQIITLSLDGTAKIWDPVNLQPVILLIDIL
jgi:WD40 repeat protein